MECFCLVSSLLGLYQGYACLMSSISSRATSLGQHVGVGLLILKCPTMTCLGSLCGMFSIINSNFQNWPEYSSCANFDLMSIFFQDFILFIYIFKIFFVVEVFTVLSCMGWGDGLEGKEPAMQRPRDRRIPGPWWPDNQSSERQVQGEWLQTMVSHASVQARELTHM